jgi:hypothetical protein
MSSPILPTKGPTGPSTMTPLAGGAADIGAFVAELASSDDTLALEASRGGPPPELLEQLRAAGVIEQQLREGGRQLRFTPAEPGGRTRIEIHDSDGTPVRSLSVAEALELAAGKPLG